MYGHNDDLIHRKMQKSPILLKKTQEKCSYDLPMTFKNVFQNSFATIT
jgi:hypothetical protein